MGDGAGCRDMGLTSRHGEATWLEAGQERRCRDTDMMSRHDSSYLDVTTSK